MRGALWLPPTFEVEKSTVVKLGGNSWLRMLIHNRNINVPVLDLYRDIPWSNGNERTNTFHSCSSDTKGFHLYHRISYSKNEHFFWVRPSKVIRSEYTFLTLATFSNKHVGRKFGVYNNCTTYIGKNYDSTFPCRM